MGVPLVVTTAKAKNVRWCGSDGIVHYTRGYVVVVLGAGSKGGSFILDIGEPGIVVGDEISVSAKRRDVMHDETMLELSSAYKKKLKDDHFAHAAGTCQGHDRRTVCGIVVKQGANETDVEVPDYPATVTCLICLSQ